MAQRLMLPRKNEGLRKYIVPLYEKPVRRLLIQEEYAPVASLIYGPTDQPDPAELIELKSLWQELRDDILEAQAQYAPEKKPWGCTFDR